MVAASVKRNAHLIKELKASEVKLRGSALIHLFVPFIFQRGFF